MRLFFSLRIIAIAYIATLVLTACDSAPNRLLDTTAGKLAAIDAGNTNFTDTQVQPYVALLTKLEAKCDDTTTGISDTAVRAKEVFKSHNGKDVSALSIMQMIDEAIPEGSKLDCVEIISAVIALS